MVSQVLMASGFRLEVIGASGAQLQEEDALAATLLELCDVSGRHFPAHLDASTSRAFPQWTYERRFVSPDRGTRS